MEKDVLIALRKKLKMDKNFPLRLESDENFIIDERYNLVMWDDTSGIIYAACPNQHRETQVAYPASIVAITYENVVHIEAVYGSSDFGTLMQGFIEDGKTNQKSVDLITDMIFNLTDINMYVPAKDRDPSVLKKVDVATGHTEDIEPYEEPEQKPEVAPVITDMSVLTNLDETYAAKQAAFQSQVKNTLKDPVKPAEDTSEKTTAHVPPRPGDPDYVAPEEETGNTGSGVGGSGSVGGGVDNPGFDDPGQIETGGSGASGTGGGLNGPGFGGGGLGGDDDLSSFEGTAEGGQGFQPGPPIPEFGGGGSIGGGVDNPGFDDDPGQSLPGDSISTPTFEEEEGTF